jgi:hypothetical protein
VQNLDELVQLDHKDRGLPRMVPTGAGTTDAPSAADESMKASSEKKLGESSRAGEDEQSGRFVYRPPESSEGRYDHYDAVAR